MPHIANTAPKELRGGEGSGGDLNQALIFLAFKDQQKVIMPPLSLWEKLHIFWDTVHKFGIREIASFGGGSFVGWKLHNFGDSSSLWGEIGSFWEATKMYHQLANPGLMFTLRSSFYPAFLNNVQFMQHCPFVENNLAQQVMTAKKVIIAMENNSSCLDCNIYFQPPIITCIILYI